MPRSATTTDEYDFVNHIETAVSDEDVAKIRAWLNPTDYLAESSEFRRHLSSQAPETGLWICETEEYRCWHDSPDHGSLWVKGIPGAGKSVVAASLVQHLRTTEDAPVLFFFFRNIVAANFSPRSLVQDWLAQLLPHSPKLQFVLQARMGADVGEISLDDLIELFTEGLSCVPKAYCVADALDEMTLESRPFLDKLNTLAIYRPASIKLLMTSRPQRHLQSALRDSSIVHVSLQQSLVEIDILTYLNHRINEAVNVTDWVHVRSQIIDIVMERSNGLFLYAKLMVDQILPQLLPAKSIDVNVIAASLPSGLEEAYNLMLVCQRKLHGATVDVQSSILEAVIHASRPLRLNELASMIQQVHPNATLQGNFKNLITTSCGPLIEVLEDETLQIIHHSFTEFLRGDTRQKKIGEDFPIISSQTAHRNMAVHCLQYLQSGTLLFESELSSLAAADTSLAFRKPPHEHDPAEEYYQREYFGQRPERDPFDYRMARLSYPFLEYAVENWSYHASRYDVHDEFFFDAILVFTQDDDLGYRRWLTLVWGTTSKSKTGVDGMPSKLHIAAFSGLTHFAQHLTANDTSATVRDAQGRTPLHWAAKKGHTEMVQLLLDHGAEPDEADGRGLKPIHLAARDNHASCVVALLKAGVEPDTKKTKEDHAGHLLGGEPITSGECSIFYVSRNGHTETAIAMIPYCKAAVLEHLLCQSCMSDRTEVALAILNTTDVPTDAQHRGATALYFACGAGNARISLALIRRGADVMRTSKWSPRPSRNGGARGARPETSPLHHLIECWEDSKTGSYRIILDALIKAGADIEMTDTRGNTPLLLCCHSPNAWRQRPQTDAVIALIKAGADVHKKTNGGDSIIHLALQTDRDPVLVRILVEAGCDPNGRGRGGDTPLFSALRIGNYGDERTEHTEEILEYLLKNGADPDIKNDSGRTAIETAMSGTIAVFKVLLKTCKDLEVKRRCWFTLSGLHKNEQQQELVKILLGVGIDVETRRRDNGRTLLLCSLGNKELLRLLRERGAKVDSVDDLGNNALHILSLKHGYPSLEEFISSGLDPLSLNNQGDNLLHTVARWFTDSKESQSSVQRLIDLGVSVNAQNNAGMTPLHVFLESLRKNELNRSQMTIVTFLQILRRAGHVHMDEQDAAGFTPFHVACLKSEYLTAGLLAAGADASIVTNDKQNALHLACRAQKSNVVRYLLDRLGSSLVNERDIAGRTPLHNACSASNFESVASLLKYGADVTIVDTFGRTPLHACAEAVQERSLWNMFDDGFGLVRKSSKVGPPLLPGPVGGYRHREPWYRIKYGFEKHSSTRPHNLQLIAKMLVTAGIDVTAMDRSNSSSLDQALALQCPDLVQFLTENQELFARLSVFEAQPQRHKDRGDSTTYEKFKSHIFLSQPLSRLSRLSQDESVYKEVTHNPHRYLDMLSMDDLKHIVDKSLEIDAHSSSLNKLLQSIIGKGRVDRVKAVEQLILLHSSEDWLREDLCRDDERLGSPSSEGKDSALHVACQRSGSNMQMLETLVEGLEMNLETHCIAANSDRDRGDPIPTGILGGTALHALALADHWWQLEAMRYLISRGAKVDAVNHKGETPLHVAARGRRRTDGHEMIIYDDDGKTRYWSIEAVQILLGHGADPNALTKENYSVVDYASNAPEIMEKLLEHGIDPTADEHSSLFLAIDSRNETSLKMLLGLGVNVNAVDEKRHIRDIHDDLIESRRLYPLLCAALEKNSPNYKTSAASLHALIEHGADLYLPLNDHETLIHFLFEFPEYEAVDALLKEPSVSQIDFNRRDQRRRTVLMASCNWPRVLPGYAHKHCLQKEIGPPLRILDLGADATLIDNAGKTALHHLLSNPDVADDVILQFLEREEVKPTLLQKDNSGFTPLHYALLNLRPSVCESLNSKGADLLEPDPNGRTALHYIADTCLTSHRDHRRIFYSSTDMPDDFLNRCLLLWNQCLLAGGSVNGRDNAGNTPLHAFVASRSPPDLRVMKGGNKDRKSVSELPCHIEAYGRLFLPDSEVDVQAANDAGETALHVIARRMFRSCNGNGHERHDKELFEFLMAKGLDPLREDGKGRSAIDVASACDHKEIVKLFVRK